MYVSIAKNVDLLSLSEVSADDVILSSSPLTKRQLIESQSLVKFWRKQGAGNEKARLRYVKRQLANSRFLKRSGTNENIYASAVGHLLMDDPQTFLTSYQKALIPLYASKLKILCSNVKGVTMNGNSETSPKISLNLPD